MDKPKKVNSGFLLLGALLIATTALFVSGGWRNRRIESFRELASRVFQMEQYYGSFYRTLTE
jgi:hypothetical protein